MYIAYIYFFTDILIKWFHYASPTSGEAYRDRRLTTNFEFWVEIFCVPTCFHVRIPKPCLSVRLSVWMSICPYPEKRNHHSFVQKSSKFEFWLLTKSWNHLSFVNISPALVIDTSMERSSRVLQHGNIKFWFFQTNFRLNFDLYFVWLVFFLSSKLNFDLYFDLCQRMKSFK